LDAKLSGQITDLDASLSGLDAKLSGQIIDLDASLSERMENSTALINVKIENDVTKRIELLSDGFKLSYEKQLETEKRICELERKVEKLEIKVG
jgi:hypothetical protein